MGFRIDYGDFFIKGELVKNGYRNAHVMFNVALTRKRGESMGRIMYWMGKSEFALKATGNPTRVGDRDDHENMYEFLLWHFALYVE
jgi:hypothetical protein